MNHLIEEYTGEEITAKNFANDTELPEYIECNKKQRDVFASRFQIDFEGAEYREQQYLWDKDKGFPELPFNNVRAVQELTCSTARAYWISYMRISNRQFRNNLNWLRLKTCFTSSHSKKA